MVRSVNPYQAKTVGLVESGTHGLVAFNHFVAENCAPFHAAVLPAADRIKHDVAGRD
jgi:hypothetical protein